MTADFIFFLLKNCIKNKEDINLIYQKSCKKYGGYKSNQTDFGETGFV